MLGGKIMKILKIFLKMIYSLLFALLVLSATFILLTTYEIIPRYNFFVVMSGSMEPAIRTGSIISVREEEEYGIDDIITVDIPERTADTFTHRIVEEIEEDGETKYITKGDANETEDPEPVSEDLIIGSLFFKIPYLGYLINFARQPTGFILMVIVPAMIIIGSEVNIIRDEISKMVSKKKEKKEGEMEEEGEEE
jgi:signal peptidase I